MTYTPEDIAQYQGKRVNVHTTDGKQRYGTLHHDRGDAFIRLLPTGLHEPVGFVEPVTIALNDIAAIEPAN